MSNAWTLGFLVFVMTVQSRLALMLGITEPSELFTPPDTPDPMGDVGALEALKTVINWVFSNISSYTQLISFQSNLPMFLNMLFLSAAFMVLYIVIVIVRGGAG